MRYLGIEVDNALAIAEQIDGDISEGDGHNLVDGVRFAAAKIVSQIADHDFVAGTAANFLAQSFADIHFFAMPVSIGLSVFLDRAFFPDRAFGYDDQCVMAGIIAFIFGEKLGDAIDVEGIFRDQAAS